MGAKPYKYLPQRVAPPHLAVPCLGNLRTWRNPVRQATRTRGTRESREQERQAREFLAEPVMQVCAESALFPSYGIEQRGFEFFALRHVVNDADEHWLTRVVRLADRNFGGKSRPIPAPADRFT